MNHPILASGLLTLAGLAQAAFAAGVPEDSKAARYIVEFDDEVIEARRDGSFELVDAKDVGKPPIEIIAKDNKGFVKVRTRDGDEIWLSLSYIKLDEDERPVCIQADIGKRTDRRLASAHGMGDQGCVLRD